MYSPLNLPIKLPDLKSRILAFNHIVIDKPDLEFMHNMLFKLFLDRQLRVGPEILGFIVSRIERSYKAILNIVDEIDSQSLVKKKAINIQLLKEIMKL
jgi:chromosomal replication initiation ATPase DnaA